MATERRFVPVGRLLAEEEFVRVLKAHLPKPWGRKVIWRSVLIYILALLIATTLALVQHGDWFEILVWYVLFLPVACVISRSYL